MAAQSSGTCFILLCCIVIKNKRSAGVRHHILVTQFDDVNVPSYFYSVYKYLHGKNLNPFKIFAIHYMLVIRKYAQSLLKYKNGCLRNVFKLSRTDLARGALWGEI